MRGIISTGEIDPTADGKNGVRQVGIFWGRRNGAETRVILQAGVAFVKAKAYRDCPTYPGGHYDAWKTWRRLRATGSQPGGIPPTMRKYEYDSIPGDRIVHRQADQGFVLYADRRLRSPVFIDCIVARFGLTGATGVIRGDPHYRTLPSRRAAIMRASRRYTQLVHKANTAAS